MTRIKSRPHHRENISTEIEGYKMLWSSIENDENAVQRLPSPIDIPQGPHPVAAIDSGDSRDAQSDESSSYEIPKIKSSNSSAPQLPDSRISSGNSLDEGSCYVRNLLDDLNPKSSNARLAAILLSKNSPSPTGSSQSPAIEQSSVSRFQDVSSSPNSDLVPLNLKSVKRSRVVETDDDAQQESAQHESFPSGSVNGHCENGSSTENTQFSDLNFSPRSVQPLVELSDLTPLLGNSPQSPNRDDLSQDVETPVETRELIDDVVAGPAEPISDTADSPPFSQNSDMAEKTAGETVDKPHFQVEPLGHSDTQDPPLPPDCDSDLDRSHNEDKVPGDPDSIDQELRTAVDNEVTQVRSPFLPEMHIGQLDVNKCNPDPLSLDLPEDDSTCQNDEAPTPIPLPNSSTTTGRALNLLTAMLVATDDVDFSNFSCIERLGPDFDPSNVNFLTHSEINKEISADQSSSSSLGDFTGKNSLFNLPASQSDHYVFEGNFLLCTNVPITIKLEPDCKHKVDACILNFSECIIEDSGVFTMRNINKISSESSDADSIVDGSIDDSDSIDDDRCQVIVERLPSSFARTDHLSLSNKRFVAWRKNFARERNEELFQHLRVWRRGRLLLWRECELAGMDRETYDRQVQYVKQHIVEVGCVASDSSDSEDASIDSEILSTGQISSDSSDSEISLDFEMAGVPSPPAVVSRIQQKPRPKSKKLEFQNRLMSGKPSPSKEEYVVERNTINEGKDSNVVNPPSALKITIRKASITKSDDEIERPEGREISSDEDIPLNLPVAKVRRVAMKRTTRRASTPVQRSEPPVASSSTDDEFALSPNKTSPPDAIRRKKSYFVEENDDESLLGRRADEVENHNLLERFEIPFEEPTLFRSPRMASKLAQLKNKEAFKSVIKHLKAPKIDPILKDVKIVVDELVLKTVEAILTQPRPRIMALRIHPEDLNIEKISNEESIKSESVNNLMTDKKLCNVVDLVEKECEPITKPAQDPLIEITSSVTTDLREKQRANFLDIPKNTAKAISSAREFAVTSTHQTSSSLADPKDSCQPLKADSDKVVESSDNESSQESNATPTTTCHGEIPANESAQKDKPAEQRATRARQPNIEVDLDLIETLVGKKKKRSSPKKGSKIAKSLSTLETAKDSVTSDDGANVVTTISANDFVTTTSKPQPRKKKRRRISKFARRPPRQKPLSEKIVRESNLENEKEVDSSKSLVQVAEISEGQGSEHIFDPSSVQSTSPEPQFTRRVLRSHPRAASLKSSPRVSENVDSGGKKANRFEERVEPSKTISTDLSSSPASSVVELSNIDTQPCDLKRQSASALEFLTEPSKTSTVEVQLDRDQAPSTEQSTVKDIEELPEISENLNLETEGDEESLLDDWHSVGSPVNEVDKSGLETAGESSKNARDESSILFDALLASSFSKKACPDQTSKSDTSLPSEKASSSLKKTGIFAVENHQQPNEKNATTSTLPGPCKDNMNQASNEVALLDGSGITDSSTYPNFSIDQMSEIAKAMEENSGTDMVDDAALEKVDNAMLENNQQSLLNSEEQLDFSSLSNILDMADSAEDLIIDQPFSDDEPEQDGIKDCINNLIQNHIDISDSPTKDKAVANPGVAKDSAKSQSKDGSIDERTGLPTTLIQRLRDPRIRSKVMSQLDGSEKVDLPQILIQAAMQSVSDSSKSPIEPKDSASKVVENQNRDPCALRSTEIITRSCIESAQNVQPTIPIVSEQMSSVNHENASEQMQADCLPKTIEDSVQPAIADEEDEEEEALKRRPKKMKKLIDTELMYRSPLEDLEKEPLQSYSRALPRRYPMNDLRPRSSVGNRPSRWDMRNSVGKTGPQERHPETVQMPPVRSQPLPLIPVAQPAHPHNWMMDQNAECLPSYVESPQWQGSWMNDQAYNSIDRRNAWMTSQIIAIQREPKPSNPKTFPLRKPVLPYMRNAFNNLLPKPSFDLNSDDEEIVISMMDPFGQEIDMVQLPRPTAKVTKSYLLPGCSYKSIEEMIIDPSIAFSQYIDEEKVDELVLDFFDEGDAAKIVRMQSHVPVKKSELMETEQSTDENINESKTDCRSDSFLDEVVEGAKVEKTKESVEVNTVIELSETDSMSSEPSGEKSKSNDKPSDENKVVKKPKIPQPTGKMEYLDIILHHLPILKEQYSFKTTPLKAPVDKSKNPLISGPSDQKRAPSIPEKPASPSPPNDIENFTPVRNPSPPRIMKALLNLTKSETRCPRRISKRSRSKSRSPPPRKRSKSPTEYRSRRRRQSPRRSLTSYSKRSRSPADYRRTAFCRHRSPKSRRRLQASKETSSECSTPRYSRSSRSPSDSSSRRRHRRAPSLSSSRSTTPLPKAYRRSGTLSPSGSCRSRSISKSPPRKRYSKR